MKLKSKGDSSNVPREGSGFLTVREGLKERRVKGQGRMAIEEERERVRVGMVREGQEGERVEGERREDQGNRSEQIPYLVYRKWQSQRIW